MSEFMFRFEYWNLGISVTWGEVEAWTVLAASGHKNSLLGGALPCGGWFL